MLEHSVSRTGTVKLTTKFGDNIVPIAFDTPLAGDYAVAATLELPKGPESWGWSQIEYMVYDKTSSGFKVDLYHTNKNYPNVGVVLNWVALPV